MRLAAGSGALRSGLPNAWRSCPRRRKKAESGEPGTAFTRRTGALRVLAAAGRRAGVRVEGLLATRVAGEVRRLLELVVRGCFESFAIDLLLELYQPSPGWYEEDGHSPTGCRKSGWLEKPGGFSSQPFSFSFPRLTDYGTMLNISVTSPENPLAEPSQYMLQVQVVVLPSVPGVQMMISEPSPLTPVTLKLPSVVR